MILIKDKKLLETSVVKSSIDTLTPATVYFQLMSWIVKNGNFKDEILDFSKLSLNKLSDVLDKIEIDKMTSTFWDKCKFIITRNNSSSNAKNKQKNANDFIQILKMKRHFYLLLIIMNKQS